MTEESTTQAEPATVTVTPAPMLTKVRIDTPGASVDIEAPESLETVAEVAMRLFREAGGWPQVRSQSAGFATLERRDTPPAQSSSMPYAPGQYPVQWP